jgi:hypothetical protein
MGNISSTVGVGSEVQAIRGFSRLSCNPASLRTDFSGLPGSLLLWPAKFLARCADLTKTRPATGAFTSRLPTSRSPFSSLGITTTVTGLFCRRDFHPLECQLALLHHHEVGLTTTLCGIQRTELGSKEAEMRSFRNPVTRCATTHYLSTSNLGLQIDAIRPYITYKHGAFRRARLNEAKFFKKPKAPLVPWVHVRDNRGKATRRSTAHNRTNGLARDAPAPYTARKDESDFVGAPQSRLSDYHPLKQNDEIISRTGLICANGFAHKLFGLRQRLGSTRPKPHCLGIGKDRMECDCVFNLEMAQYEAFRLDSRLVPRRFHAQILSQLSKQDTSQQEIKSSTGQTCRH